MPSKIVLNDQQQKAADFHSGAAMIIAGAGSGKTRVITSRISSLLSSGEIGSRIVALTFTNKAAKEMKDRLFSGEIKFLKKPFIGTFHSYCLYLLQRYGKDFNLDSFSILDATDQLASVKSILKKYSLEKEFTPRKVLSFISNKKNDLISTQSFDPAQRRLSTIFEKYEEEKKKNKLLDFDDIILTVYKKIVADPAFASKIQGSIDHILIDEYQDTNGIQHDLIRRLSSINGQLMIKSVFAVGDEDQSIYSWRGAVVENVEKFKKDFAPVELIKIEQNYRSVDSILNAANKVIQNNKVRNDKNLWSDKKKANRILHLSFKNEYQEAEVAADFLSQIKKKSESGSCAILYRNHSQSRLLEEALIQAQLPYKIVGGLRFYERKEIKDVLAYLKLIVNRSDFVAFSRIINCPARGLGEKFVLSVYHEWMEHLDPDFEYILTVMSPDFSTSYKNGVGSFKLVFEGLDRDSSPTKSIEQILQRTNYFDYLRKSYEKDEAEDKIDNVKELIKSVEKFEADSSDKKITLADFLHEIALIQEHQELDSKNKVSAELISLMTLHSAKGLEFDNVVLVGLEERGLPGLKGGTGVAEIEEERRLFYVGMTRAKERLLLTSAMSRNEYGTILCRDESRFVKEIPNDLVLKIENDFYSRAIFSGEIGSWIQTDGVKRKKSCDDKPRFSSQSNQSLRSSYNNFSPRKNVVSTKSVGKSNSFWQNQKSFVVGARVLHKTFGLGSVVAPIQGTVVPVKFGSQVKKISKDFLTLVPKNAF